MRHFRIPPAAIAAAAEPSPDALAMFLLTYPREKLEALTDALVAALDALDGNPDREDDDPAGDPLDAGEAPEATPIMPTRPVYAIDQSTGPINEAQAYRRYRMEMLEG